MKDALILEAGWKFIISWFVNLFQWILMVVSFLEPCHSAENVSEPSYLALILFFMGTWLAQKRII